MAISLTKSLRRHVQTLSGMKVRIDIGESQEVNQATFSQRCRIG